MVQVVNQPTERSWTPDWARRRDGPKPTPLLAEKTIATHVLLCCVHWLSATPTMTCLDFSPPPKKHTHTHTDLASQAC